MCSARQILELIVGEEGVRSRPDHLGGDDDGDRFVDNMIGVNVEAGAKSEGFTFADSFKRATLSVETIAESVINAIELLTCYSSSTLSLVFFRNNKKAVQIFHQLILSACFYMKKEPWGYCFSVFIFFRRAWR